MADHEDDHDHDAHVGFVSPSSLTGRMRSPQPAPTPAPEPAAAAAREPDLFDPPEPGPVAPALASTPAPAPEPVKAEPGPFDRTEPFGAPLETRFSADRERLARETQTATAAARETFAKRTEQPAVPMGLYAVYVLILLAVPTLGVSALVALLAVTGREGPQEPLAASHFIYQQRTLWSAAVAAALGAVLVIVNVGVFVLFVLALWTLARGAFGVMRLKAGHAIANPRSWLF
ncbi:hypothetical protein [Brevundimonas sp.]|jgi:uncharacterized membrane protein|uniref:hypothetical protein n=1 Tax=Brevundimonas sp. TaxID=1871086 RepID=UPI0037BEAABE